MSAAPAHPHTRLARSAVGLAEAAAVMISIAFAIFGVAYAIGGTGATEDNWVGSLTVALLFAGFVASLTAFGLAVAVRVKHDRWALLFLPLAVFPALLAILVLGEAFWWE